MDCNIPPQADTLVVSISDIEMGAGGPTDDFPHDDFLAALLRRYAQPPYDRLAVTLVFNGDTFDFLKTSLYGTYPRHITAETGVDKLERIAAAHPVFFEALRDFLAAAPGRNTAQFVVGNHDLELLFEDVQDRIRQRVGHAGCHFPGFSLDIGDVRIEHGSQGDALFRMDERQLFLPFRGDHILNLPWGCTALIDVALPLQPYLYPLDRLKPRKLVLELMPEVKALLIGAYWRYWTRDYWGDMLRGRDPIKRISWTMFRELVYRFGSQDPDVRVGEHYQRPLMADKGHRLTVIGHLHTARWWSYGDRKILQTGCFRDEYMLADRGGELRPIPKTLAEIYLHGGRVVTSSLIELAGPPAPEGHMPADIFSVVSQVIPLIGSHAERARIALDERRQLDHEATEPES